MKRLILICGANGVGKSAACKALAQKMNNAAFIDSDHCRVMNPFSFSEEEISVVVSNISNMMINYFRLETIRSVVFSYGFHGPRKLIFKRILDELKKAGIEYSLYPVILSCDLDENIRRMRADGRDEERIKRAVENTREIYDAYDFPSLDVTRLTSEETALGILQIVSQTSR